MAVKKVSWRKARALEPGKSIALTRPDKVPVKAFKQRGRRMVDEARRTDGKILQIKPLQQGNVLKVTCVGLAPQLAQEAELANGQPIPRNDNPPTLLDQLESAFERAHNGMRQALAVRESKELFVATFHEAMVHNTPGGAEVWADHAETLTDRFRAKFGI